ncbi:MAG: AI-2E family transporter [Hyphomicrobiaceae bacterium]
MRAERQVLFWMVAALVLLLLIGLLKDILLPFVAGVVIAYFLNPLADALERMGMGRLWASIVILAVAILVFATLVIFIVPLLVTQAQQLAAALPGELERVKGLLETWARERLGPRFPAFETGLNSAVDGLSQNWAGIVGWLASSLWDRSLAVINFVSLLLVTPLVVFYLLVDWHPMLAKINGWLPRAHAPAIRALASDINDAVSAFIRGQGTVCIILGVFYAAALSAIGLRYGLLVGLLTGVLGFIPFVGWMLGLLTASTLAVVQFWPEMLPLALVVATFLAGQGLDAGFLGPKIVGSKIGLHPVWLIFSLFVFSYLFGFVGMLVAVPVAAAVGVLVRFAIRVYLSSPLYDSTPQPHVSAADPGVILTRGPSPASGERGGLGA